MMTANDLQSSLWSAGYANFTHKTSHIKQLVSHTSHLTPHTSHLTPHTSRLTPHTSHLTPHTSHLTPHTSHLTTSQHHTSHITHHTSHVTHHTSHVTEYVRPVVYQGRNNIVDERSERRHRVQLLQLVEVARRVGYRRYGGRRDPRRHSSRVDGRPRRAVRQGAGHGGGRGQ